MKEQTKTATASTENSCPGGKTVLRKVLYAFTALALIVAVALEGSFNVFPGALSVTVNLAVREENSPAGSVIIDSSAKRAVLLDAAGNCTEVLKSVARLGKATYYSAAAVGENVIFLAEYDLVEDRAYVAAERIVRYGFDGKKQGTVLEIEHTAEDRTLVPVIQDITVNSGSGIAVCVDPLRAEVRLVAFPLDPSGEESSRELEVPLEDPVRAWFVQTDPDCLIIRSLQNEFCRVNVRTGEAEAMADPGVGLLPVISADLGDDGSVVLKTQAALEGTAVRFTALRQTIQILFWLSLAWLACSILLAGVFGLRRFWRQKNYAAFNSVIGVAVAVCACIFIISFYSINVLKNFDKSTQQDLEASAAILYAGERDLFDSCLREYRDSGTVDPADIRSAQECLESGVYILDGLDRGINFVLVAYGADGGRYLLCDSSASVLTGVPVLGNSLWARAMQNESSELTPIYSLSEPILTSSYPITDTQGNVVGSLTAYQDMDIYWAVMGKDFSQRTILLLSILITAGFVVVEGKACVACFGNRKKMRLEGIAHEETALVRPFTFLLYMASSVNTTLLVVIIKEMAAHTSMAGNGVLISLPVSLYSLGYVLGAPLRKLLTGKLPEKRLLQMSGMLSAACYFVCFWSVTNSNIILFSVAILISNSFITVITSYCQELAFYSRSIGQSNSSISTAKISGSSISGVVAGALAGSLGNASIQLFGMAASLAAVAFITFFLPGNLQEKKQPARAADSARAAGRDLRTLLTDPLVLSVIACMLVPVTLFNGYKSYLFPYIASEGGITKSTISDIIVFCNALVFYSSSLVKTDGQKSGGVKKLFLVSGGVCAVFLMFIFNHSMLWSVLALAVASVASKTAEPLIATFWQERVLQIHTNKQNALIVVNCIENSVSTVRATILGYLLEALGYAGVCFTCGAFGALGAGIFAAILRRHAGSLARRSNFCADRTE